MVDHYTNYPEISAVIPLYNKAPYITRAIKSVLFQYHSPKEILVVDDGSTDGGGEIVRQLENPQIRLIQQENRGECAARNRGIAEAVNPYLAFLDADDEWKPDFLTKIIRLMNNFPDCGAYATSAQIIQPDGSIVYPHLVGLPSEPWIGIIPNFFELFQVGYAFNASSIVIPKKILEEVGCFPEGMTISGDVTCWVNIAMRYPIAFGPTHSVVYHQEAQNRVGTRHAPLKEMPYIPVIRNAIEAGTISGELRSAALEFMAQKQIMVAIENIMAGDPAYARQLLATCRQTKKYQRDWLWWRLWAALPVGWPRKFLTLKQMVFRPAE
jgi:hypothetical protein